jgi:hypothetical protein
MAWSLDTGPAIPALFAQAGSVLSRLDPVLAGGAAEPPRSVPGQVHEPPLAARGGAHPEVGVLWRKGTNAVLAALL